MRRSAAALAAAFAVWLAACGQTGTIDFELVFPPGVTRLPAEAVTARLTLSAPATVVEGPIAADGSFSLALDVPAEGVTGQITFEALDAAGVVVARGTSPPLPIAAYSDSFRLFVAGPGGFAEAPVALDPARADVGAVRVPFGALLAGGELAGGEASDALLIYDVYDHAFDEGAPLPAARAGTSIVAGDFGAVHVFGGRDAAAVHGQLWRFDTAVAPAGAWTARADEPAFARAGAPIAITAYERWLVAGVPVVELDAAVGAVTAVTGAPAAAEQADSATSSTAGGVVRVVLVGPAGATIYAATEATFTPVPGLVRAEHAAVLLADGSVVLAGGRDDLGALTAAIVRVDPGAATFEERAQLATPRVAPAMAVTGNVLVVAGGFDDAGAPLDDAELFDATTLAALGATPLVAPRGGAAAVTMPNGNVLLVGGRDAAGPVGVLELFTP